MTLGPILDPLSRAERSPRVVIEAVVPQRVTPELLAELSEGQSVRELIPQLQTGRVSRGVIGVQVVAVPAEALADFGMKERREDQGSEQQGFHRGQLRNEPGVLANCFVG